MKIGIAYASPHRQVWLTVDLPEGATVREAIERSGVLRLFPEIDLQRQRVGIFNKVVTLETVVEEGQRVEIYRPITADPKTARRRARAEGEPAEGEG